MVERQWLAVHPEHQQRLLLKRVRHRHGVLAGTPVQLAMPIAPHCHGGKPAGNCHPCDGSAVKKPRPFVPQSMT
jgi:hypothetical protein